MTAARRTAARIAVAGFALIGVVPLVISGIAFSAQFSATAIGQALVDDGAMTAQGRRARVFR